MFTQVYTGAKLNAGILLVGIADQKTTKSTKNININTVAKETKQLKKKKNKRCEVTV